MALYYNLVFGLLVGEMAFFGILSLPFPRKIRRTVLYTVSAPFGNQSFQIALKCILAFILVLFIDSVNRVYTVSAELHGAFSGNSGPMGAGLNNRSEIQSRRFYAQRNMYLCGFTLFLTMILSRTYSLVAELLETKDKLDSTGKDTSVSDSPSELSKLKLELKSKDEDIEILKEQAASLSKDYESVSESNIKSRA